MAKTQRAGKSSELSVAGQMLRHGLDVYMPCVDDQGIDLVLRQEREDEVEYYDVQVKSVEGYGRIIGVGNPQNQAGNYIVVLHYRHADREDEYFYLTPSQVDEHRKEGEWKDLVFNNPERERYSHQDIRGLAEAIRKGAIGPTAETD